MRRFANIAIYTLLSLTAAVSLSACATSQSFSAAPPAQESVRITVSEADVINTRATVVDEMGTLVVDFLPEGKAVSKRTQYNNHADQAYAGIVHRVVWEVEPSTNTVWIHGGRNGWFDKKGNRWQMFGTKDSWKAARFITPTHLSGTHLPVSIGPILQ